MFIRVATYNMENLFSRPRVMRTEDSAYARAALSAFAELTRRLERAVYTAHDQARIAKLITDFGAHDNNNPRRAFRINEARGRLYKVTKAGDVEVTAKGRADWTGWPELIRDDVTWEATANTARVVAAVQPDVLLAVEVEDRHTLQRFNDQVLAEFMGGQVYPYNLLIDGNDSRGIDIGILSRYPITNVRTHVFDRDETGETIFSRDCPEFQIQLPGRAPLWVLGNHFKSKGYGSPAATDQKRRTQARQVKRIYNQVRKQSSAVIVAGDLNDSLDSAPIRTLTRGTGLREAMTHRTYNGNPGTYGSGRSPNQKLDYLLLSDPLWQQVQAVEVERRGVYAPRTFASFPTVTSRASQASDHAALYADLDV